MIKKLTVKETRKETIEVEERTANLMWICDIAPIMCDELWGPYGLHYAGMFLI